MLILPFSELYSAAISATYRIINEVRFSSLFRGYAACRLTQVGSITSHLFLLSIRTSSRVILKLFLKKLDGVLIE